MPTLKSRSPLQRTLERYGWTCEPYAHLGGECLSIRCGLSDLLQAVSGTLAEDQLSVVLAVSDVQVDPENPRIYFFPGVIPV